MAVCKFCFQEVRDGVAVPGYQAASGVVHEECLAAVALKVAHGRLQIPDDLFACIIGYEHVKEDMKFTLREGRGP